MFVVITSRTGETSRRGLGNGDAEEGEERSPAHVAQKHQHRCVLPCARVSFGTGRRRRSGGGEEKKKEGETVEKHARVCIGVDVGKRKDPLHH